MKRLTTIRCAAAISLLASVVAEAAEPRIELRRNPFERPALAEIEQTAPTRAQAANPGDNPGLRAVLVAGPRSSVDLGGVILQIGESADGYELLAVEEGRAIFRNRGKKVVISLHEQDEGDRR